MHPALGRPCDEVRPGLRRMESGKHVVFYRQERGGIFVSSILPGAAAPDRAGRIATHLQHRCGDDSGRLFFRPALHLGTQEVIQLWFGQPNLRQAAERSKVPSSTASEPSHVRAASRESAPIPAVLANPARAAHAFGAGLECGLKRPSLSNMVCCPRAICSTADSRAKNIHR